MSSQLSESYKQDLLAIITKYLPVAKVYLFGSRARREQRPGSDIDIALDAGKQIDAITLMRIKNDIEESKIPVFVDVIDLHNVSDDFKNFITKDLIPWKN